MSKFLITAANCFIGMRLCKALTRRGHFVYGIVREGFSQEAVFEGIENISLIRCNMENYSNLIHLIPEKIDMGVMLAWDGTRGELRNDKERQENNYKYSVECIDALIKLGCRTIMTAGSQAEYGPMVSGEKVSEDYKCNPNTEYGKWKLELYNSLRKSCLKEGIRFLEPRFFSLYGEGDYENSLIISTLRNMLANRECKLTFCTQIWDYLYVDDAVDALVLLMESSSESGVYNLGSGNSRPLKDYVEEMRMITGTKSELKYGSVAYPETGIVNTNPCVEKVMTKVSWKPQTSFEDGIKRIVADITN